MRTEETFPADDSLIRAIIEKLDQPDGPLIA